jgi:hypothetical protein
MNFLPGWFPVGAAAAAAAVAATITFTDSSVNTTDASVQTFTTQSFSTATASDYIIVLIVARAINPRTISSVTVDGQAASAVAFIDHAPDTNDNFAAIYIAPATGAASGTVEVTWSDVVIRCGIGVFVAKNLQSTTATATATDSGVTLSVSLNVNAGGIALAVLFCTDTTANSWTGLTERYEDVIETSNLHTGASDAFASTQVNLTIENNMANVDSAFAAASFR